MSTPLLGKFVMYTPTRQDFAISSGSSSTGHPANKRRPCLVVGYTHSDNPSIAPLLGAAEDPNTGFWVPRSGMNLDHWSPIKLKNRSTVPVPHNSSTLAGTPYEVNDNNFLEPILPFKPCYVWTADGGEEVFPSAQLYLTLHDALGYVDQDVLKQMRLVMAQIKQDGKAPPDGSGAKLKDLI